jgi:16S rRNA (uracil1498-N3)-methyltransferase
VDRDDRAPVATFFVEAAFAVGATVALSESAAHHARVKRLESGDRVRLSNGAGRVGQGTIASLGKRGVDIAVESAEDVPAPPALHLRVPIGDKERMLWLAEKATELGISTWQAVRFRRSMSVTPRGEGAGFAEKIHARMISALEQSGGAWLPRILPDAAPSAIDKPHGAQTMLLDVAGEPMGVASSTECVIVFGPEGGLEPAEREALMADGWTASRLAGTTLRFETAGVAAVAVVRAAQLSKGR